MITSTTHNELFRSMLHDETCLIKANLVYRALLRDSCSSLPTFCNRFGRRICLRSSGPKVRKSARMRLERGQHFADCLLHLWRTQSKIILGFNQLVSAEWWPRPVIIVYRKPLRRLAAFDICVHLTSSRHHVELKLLDYPVVKRGSNHSCSKHGRKVSLSKLKSS